MRELFELPANHRWRAYFTSHPRRKAVYHEAEQLNRELCSERPYSNSYRKNVIDAFDKGEHDFGYTVAPPLILDLHGFRRQGAGSALIRFLKLIREGGLLKTRVVHGKGKGALQKKAVSVLTDEGIPEKHRGLGVGDDHHLKPQDNRGYIDIRLPNTSTDCWPNLNDFLNRKRS